MKKKTMKLNIFLMILSAMILTSCGDDDDDTVPAPTGSGTSPVSTMNAFDGINNTITSLTTRFPTTTCNTTTGAPTSTPGSATYVTDALFCTISSAPTTTGSIRSGYSKTAGILCAINKASPMTNGTTPTVHDNVSISESDACFTSGPVDLNSDGDTADTVPFSFRETTGGQGDYDTKVELQTNATTFNTTGTSDTTLYLKNTAGMAAAKSVTNTNVTEAVINRTSGESFYDSRDYTNNRHTRMYAKGTVDTNGSITNLQNLQMIQASGNAGSEQHSVMYATDGTNTWSDHYVGTTRASGFDTCTTSTTGGTADCSAIDIPYNADFHDFTGNPATGFNNGTMMSTTAPITMSF